MEKVYIKDAELEWKQIKINKLYKYSIYIVIFIPLIIVTIGRRGYTEPIHSFEPLILSSIICLSLLGICCYIYYSHILKPEKELIKKNKIIIHKDKKSELINYS